MTEPQAPSTATSPVDRNELLGRSFLALVVTQFLGACNDASLRYILPTAGAALLPGRQALAIALPAIWFLLPWIILSPVAGYLADRVSKQKVLVACKISELTCMAGLVVSLMTRRVEAIYVVAFCFAATLALCNPSKLGSIPDMVRFERIPAANAVIVLMTVVALVVGYLFGSWLFANSFPNYSLPEFAGDFNGSTWWMMVAAFVGIGFVGVVAALLIKPLPAADASVRLSWNFPRTMANDLQTLRVNKNMSRVVVTYAFFWAIGTFASLTTFAYAETVLHVKDLDRGMLLGVLTLGAGLGSVFSGIASAGLIELGLVPIGALIVSFASASLYFTHESYRATLVALFGIGFGGGVVNVPLYSYIQGRSPPEKRGAILAANNFVAFLSMLAATGCFYLLLSQGLFFDEPLLSPRGVFLAAGLASLPVAIYGFYIARILVARAVVGMIFRCFFKIEAYGRDDLPRGGALLVCNHLSWIDGLLIGITCPRAPRMIAYAAYVQHPMTRWFCKFTKVIPIEPGSRQAVGAIREAREAIRNGEYVCIFAEGVLSRTGQLLQFQPGLLKVLKDTGAPVVPMYLEGLWGTIFSWSEGTFFWKRPKRWRAPLAVHYGPPLSGTDEVAPVRRAVEQVWQHADELRKPQTMILTRRFLRECRRSRKRSKAVDTSGAELTGGTMLVRTLILERVLRRKVLAADERFVGVLLPPSTAGLVSNAALALGKRVSVNLNYTMSAETINACIKQAGIRHVLTSRKVMQKLDIKLDAEIVYLEDFRDHIATTDKIVGAMLAFATPISVLERIYGLTTVQPDDLLTVIFTSGSTGEPKGVMLSYHNIGTNVTAINQVVHLRDTDVIAGILPFFHSFGYTVTLWTILTLPPKGAYHFSPLDARQIGELCRTHKVTILLATPTFLRSYLRRCPKEDFATIDVVVAGAEKLPVDLCDAFEKQFGVRPSEGYGCTELSPLVSVNIPASRAPKQDQPVAKEGTVGRTVPGVAAKITDLDTGEELPAEKPGMLWIKGPNVMLGYLHQPEKTAQVIRDGWYMTGDVALLDKDGFIKITGRESRFSKIGGEMVPHIKIEETLATIIKAPEDETTFVVTAVPDDKRGERIVVVHTKLEQTPDSIVKALQASGLPNLWIPSSDSFVEVEKIPVLGTGKLDLRGVKTVALEKFGPR
jgi:acyl-[acyl-carrier-protein]-phospholipid O-acyltransferase/long-chain-fatty-acid--[acyl-carrier-protein] ligase